jgi:AraC-like DNA-binding protein
MALGAGSSDTVVLSFARNITCNQIQMIGKTRQQLAADLEEVYDPEVGKARGILRRSLPAGKLRHSRRRPSSEVMPWIAHYWMINWDLGGCEPQVVGSLPHPNIHLIFEKGTSVVSGVQTCKFSRVLEGQARVFGVKFRPGGFRPFLESPVSKLADRVVPANRIFGRDLEPLEAIVLSSGKEDDKVRAVDDFFRARAPKRDPMIELAGQLVERILREPEIKSVDDLASHAVMSKRRLQRIFNEYVGVSPKWVIRRYRMHELIEKINSGSRLDWSQVALDLGYFDQAHLINDFKSIVGYSPTQYQKLILKSSGH